MTSPIEPLRVLCDLGVSAVKLDAKPVHRRGAKDAEIMRRELSRDSSFRMPAEWEPHEATWIGWPHNRTDWPGKFAAIPWVYAEIVKHLAPAESVRVLVESPAHEKSARRLLERVGVDP